jgi:sugar phosphate isomerase/epimerase
VSPGAVPRHRAIGVARVVLGLDLPVEDAAARANELGWEHIDITVDPAAPFDQPPLALPVGDRYTGEVPVTGCTVRTPRREVPWDDAVAFLRSVPGVYCEPSPYSMLNRADKIRAMCEAVPGLRLTLDTGHVTTWGEDPIELLDLAGHVQLRQARKGVPQVHVDDHGDVDFRAVLRRLDDLGYQGLLSVEYFDLPQLGLPLDDPVGWALALTSRVRALL